MTELNCEPSKQRTNNLSRSAQGTVTQIDKPAKPEKPKNRNDGFIGMGKFTIALLVSVLITLMIWAAFEFVSYRYGAIDLIWFQIFNKSGLQETSSVLSVVIGLPIAFAGAYAVIRIAQETHQLSTKSHKLSEETRDHDYFMLISDRLDKLGNCYTQIMPEINNFLQQISNFHGWLTLSDDYFESGHLLFSNYLKNESEYDEEKNKKLTVIRGTAAKELEKLLEELSDSYLELKNKIIGMDEKFVVDFLMRTAYGDENIKKMSFYKFVTRIKNNNLSQNKFDLIRARLCISEFCIEKSQEVEKYLSVGDSDVDSYVDTVRHLEIDLPDLLRLIEALLGTSDEYIEHRVYAESSFSDENDEPVMVWDEHMGDGEVGKPMWCHFRPEQSDYLLEITKYLLMLIPSPEMNMNFLQEQLPNNVYQKFQDDLPHLTELYNFRSGLPDLLLPILDTCPKVRGIVSSS